MPDGVVKNKASVIIRLKNYWKLVAVFILIILIAAAAIAYFSNSNHNKLSSSAQASLDIKQANEAYLKGNKAQALEYAREALAQDPSNQTAIGFIATLTPNHTESQQLYAQMLEYYIKTSGDKKDPTAVTYWSEGNLAEKAGKFSQANEYYQESIAIGKASSNIYYQNVAQRSEIALGQL